MSRQILMHPSQIAADFACREPTSPPNRDSDFPQNEQVFMVRIMLRTNLLRYPWARKPSKPLILLNLGSRAASWQLGIDFS
jgi:hypothetical protein